MHRLTELFFAFVLAFSLISCKEDEKPDGRIPLTIDGFSLTSANVPGGRLLADGEWEHSFGEKISLVFVSQSTQTNYPFTFVPDFRGVLPEVFLPPGSYFYYGSSDASQITSYLPVQIEGFLEITAPTSALLQGKTAYQLVSFSDENLSEESHITHPQETPLFHKDGYYYAYVIPALLFKTELVLKNGNRIHWGVDAQAFTHSSFSFRTSTSSSSTPPLSDPHLVFSEVRVNLDTESAPDRMPPFYQVELDADLTEASGLQFVGQHLYTINDGGNAAEIYEIDQYHGQVIRRIRVTNASNIDWEDLASDSQFLYIGDFGNNLGNRTDLRVLRISLNELETKNDVQAEVIHFSYDRQSGSPSAGEDHRFDCEAMVYHGGQLLLFTKPTNAQGSDVYILDPKPGTQVARYAGTFETEGWITGAEVTRNGKNLVFIGYENAGATSQAFIGVIKNPQLPAISGNPMKTIRLGAVAFNSQTEGIAIDADYRVKIAGEQINQGGLTVPQRLSELDLKGILAN
jgi:hypothetical protein